MAQQITKQTLIGEMLQMDMGIAAILMAAGMHCVGCPSSAMESLEEACMVHGIDVYKRQGLYYERKQIYHLGSGQASIGGKPCSSLLGRRTRTDVYKRQGLC